jgi:hypothetical protein
VQQPLRGGVCSCQASGLQNDLHDRGQNVYERHEHHDCLRLLHLQERPDREPRFGVLRFLRFFVHTVFISFPVGFRFLLLLLLLLLFSGVLFLLAGTHALLHRMELVKRHHPFPASLLLLSKQFPLRF